jgi:hypothetical protein
MEIMASKSPTPLFAPFSLLCARKGSAYPVAHLLILAVEA